MRLVARKPEHILRTWKRKAEDGFRISFCSILKSGITLFYLISRRRCSFVTTDDSPPLPSPRPATGPEADFNKRNKFSFDREPDEQCRSIISESTVSNLP